MTHGRCGAKTRFTQRTRTIVFTGCGSGQNTFPVIESTSNLWSNDQVIILGLPGSCADGSDYILSDDDNLSILPHNPDGEPLLTTALAEAYIIPRYLGDYCDAVEFEHHLGIQENIYGGSWTAGRDVWNHEYHWTVHVVGCWELDEEEDADPDVHWSLFPPFEAREGAEIGTYGGSHWISAAAAIFLQTLADGLASGCCPTDENHAVVHEIGHLLGQWNHVTYSIMEDDAPQRENRFKPETICIFRNRTD